MKLTRLLKILEIEVPIHEEIEIRNISFHSKQVKRGDLFVAVSGYSTDGHHFIQDAVAAGASAVIGEREMDSLPVPC